MRTCCGHSTWASASPQSCARNLLERRWLTSKHRELRPMKWGLSRRGIKRFNLPVSSIGTDMEVLREPNFDFLGKKKIGKVRDIYEQPDRLILVTTDRHSSFDRIIAHIPWKWQVLNQVSAWWFEQTKDIVPNHVLSIPDPNVTIARPCEILPVEVVVRTALTGTTSTSIWVNYQKGQREFGGLTLPDGLKKNTILERPIITPTTKFEEHDRNLTGEEIVAEGLLSKEDWERVSDMALKLFDF